MMGRAWCLAAALASCSSGCGGEVNLGGKSSDSWPGDGGKTVGGAYAVETELVHQLFPYFMSSDTLAVAGDYVYFAGASNGRASLHRCRKTSCRATVEGLANVSDNIHNLQVYEQRLGVAAGDGDRYWLSSYALPSASDQQVAIDNLPRGSNLNSLFHGGFVYWSLLNDNAIYRCALPACANGPERVGSSRNDTWLYGEGDLIFWLHDSFVQRAAQLGSSPAQRLLPDQTLSEAAADAALDASRDYAAFIATSLGMLYAGLRSTSPGCEASTSSPRAGPGGCVGSVVRWPVQGGARETIHSLEERVSRFFVVENELVWVSRHVDHADRGTLSSCRVEACAATRRDLGLVSSELRGFAHDESHLYWLETTQDGANFSRPIQIRRVARLAAP